jgi:hypothetical protein
MRIPTATRNQNLKAYTGCVVESRRSHLRGSPVFVLGLVAAAAVFGLALLIGWATAGTHERLGRASPVPAPPVVRSVALLRRVAPLPAAPPPRPKSQRPAAPEIPRLIIGSG